MIQFAKYLIAIYFPCSGHDVPLQMNLIKWFTLAILINKSSLGNSHSKVQALTNKLISVAKTDLSHCNCNCLCLRASIGCVLVVINRARPYAQAKASPKATAHSRISIRARVWAWSGV